MDRRELLDALEPALLAALGGWQSGVYTALPGIVQSFDASAGTCTIQPALMAKVSNADGSTSWAQLPLLVDVPVYFPSGGGFTLTFPVAANDEALIVFSSRCIDNWWQASGVQQQAELRMHDLSDGFAFVGFHTLPRKLSPVTNTTGAQLRSDNGATYVEVDATDIKATAPGTITATAPNVKVVATTKVEITTPLVTMSGNLTVTGAITGNGGMAISGGSGSTISGNLTHTTGNLTSNGKTLHTHTHGGVTTGSGTTGAPT
jgi:hypothetical protein